MICSLYPPAALLVGIFRVGDRLQQQTIRLFLRGDGRFERSME
jgi:hypothetical protein